MDPTSKVAQLVSEPGVSGRRLLQALLGMLLYLGGGAALALYCFARNAHHEPARDEVAKPVTAEGADSEPPLPSPPAHQPTVSVAAAEQRKLNDAIARGVWFLKDYQLPEGTWGNENTVAWAALPGLTLLECGVPADDPGVRKAATFVRQNANDPRLGLSTYQRSLAVLFLDRLGDPRDEALIRHLAVCLMVAQHPTAGAWHYDSPVIDPSLVPELLKDLHYDSKQSLADWRKKALRGGTFVPNGWDNSNTQFAILALWAAQRHGVTIDKSIALAEKHFRSTRQPNGPDLPKGVNLNLEGSWLYDEQNNSSRWPSMTCSGLLALAVAHAVTTDPQEKKQKPLDDPAIQRALAMLAREIDRPGESRLPDYYYLWSLERIVGVLYNLPKIEAQDWYAWGRNILLPRQQPDGHWKDGGYWGSQPVLDTCFVLLFLKQANLAADLTSKLELLNKAK